jgi:hypothetical protein
MDGINGNDFQHNNIVYILNKKDQLPNPRGIWINKENLIAISIYNGVRHCMAATWLNDRDQFLFPKDKWKKDIEFQTDCLAYTLFSNNIQSKHGTNHWIPFTEHEVNARDKFESNFMTDFMKGKIQRTPSAKLFKSSKETKNAVLEFSNEAKAVFESGKALWQYYHQQPNCNVNASFYDIREHFQERNEKGKMNNKSEDETYTSLIKELRKQLQILELKLQPKVYEYGFLKE